MYNGLQHHRRPLIIVFIFLTILQCRAQDFSYNGPKGPNHWGEQYNTCDGKYQSPINIDEALVTNVSLSPLQFVGFDDWPQTAQLKNNGHTAKVTMTFKDRTSIAGGPLDGSYEFTQFHFHWGATDSYGSEDLINNQSFPMEIHFVFFKNKYDQFDNALNYRDGIAVLAGFFEISAQPNPAYEELTILLGDVVEPQSSAMFLSPPKLSDFLPKDVVHYYTYNGSLTTPPCSEVVTWIDFSQPIPISSQQLEKFRQIRDQHGDILTQNTRPIQPLNGRQVYYSMDEVELHIIPSHPDTENGNDLNDIRYDIVTNPPESRFERRIHGKNSVSRRNLIDVGLFGKYIQQERGHLRFLTD